jgi:hypothetical protein
VWVTLPHQLQALALSVHYLYRKDRQDEARHWDRLCDVMQCWDGTQLQLASVVILVGRVQSWNNFSVTIWCNESPVQLGRVEGLNG